MKKYLALICTLVLLLTSVFVPTAVTVSAEEAEATTLTAAGQSISDMFIQAPMMQMGSAECFLNWDNIHHKWGTSESTNRGYVVAKPAVPGTKFTMTATVNQTIATAIETALSLESGNFDLSFYASADLYTWNEVTATRTNSGTNNDALTATYSLTVPENCYFIKAVLPNDRSYSSAVGAVYNNAICIKSYTYTPSDAVTVYNLNNSADQAVVSATNGAIVHDGGLNMNAGYTLQGNFCYYDLSSTNRGYVVLSGIPSGRDLVITTADKKDCTDTWEFLYSVDNTNWNTLEASTAAFNDVYNHYVTYQQTMHSHKVTLPDTDTNVYVKIVFPQNAGGSWSNMHHCLYTVSHTASDNTMEELLCNGSALSDLFLQAPAMEIGTSECRIIWDVAYNGWGTSATTHRAYVIAKPAMPGSTFTMLTTVNKTNIALLEESLGLESGEWDLTFYASPDLYSWTKVTADVKQFAGTESAAKLSYSLTVPEDCYYIKAVLPNDRAYNTVNSTVGAGNNLIVFNGYHYTPSDAVTAYNFYAEADRTAGTYSIANLEVYALAQMYNGYTIGNNFAYYDVSETNRGYIVVKVPSNTVLSFISMDAVGTTDVWEAAYSTDDTTYTALDVETSTLNGENVTIKGKGTTYVMNSHRVALPKADSDLYVKIIFPQKTAGSWSRDKHGLSVVSYKIPVSDGSVTQLCNSATKSDVFVSSPGLQYNSDAGVYMPSEYILTDEGWGTADTDNSIYAVSKAAKPGSVFKLYTTENKTNISLIEAALGLESGEFAIEFYASADLASWVELDVNRTETGSNDTAMTVTYDMTLPEYAYYIKAVMPIKRSYAAEIAASGYDLFKLNGYKYYEAESAPVMYNLENTDDRSAVYASNGIEYGNNGTTYGVIGAKLSWSFGYQSVSETNRGYIAFKNVKGGNVFTITSVDRAAQVSDYAFAYSTDGSTWTDVSADKVAKTTLSGIDIHNSTGVIEYDSNTTSFVLPEGDSTYYVRVYFPQTTKVNGNNMYNLVTAVTYGGEELVGDVNRDLAKDANDTVAMKKLLLGVTEADAVEEYYADVKTDGVVDVLDFIRLKKNLANG